MLFAIWTSFKEAEPELLARLAALASHSYEELARLPEASPTDMPDGMSTCTVLRKLLKDGRLEIVVQAYRPGMKWGWFRRADVLARGIWVSRTGPAEPMPEQALYDYM